MYLTLGFSNETRSPPAGTYIKEPTNSINIAVDKPIRKIEFGSKGKEGLCHLVVYDSNDE